MDKTKKLKFIIGLSITGLIALMTIIGIVKTPYDPCAMDGAAKLAGISLKHPFGCDQFGRDILSRVLVGVRETMLISACVVFIGVFFGTIIGTITGYFGGWLDEILMRLNDAVLAFPSVLLALVVIGLYGSGRYQLIAALGHKHRSGLPPGQPSTSGHITLLFKILQWLPGALGINCKLTVWPSKLFTI